MVINEIFSMNFICFWCIFQELAVAHCLNSETMLPNLALGDSRQQGANLSFAAIDMFAKLVLLLVKVLITSYPFPKF